MLCHRLGIVMLRNYGALAHVLGLAIERRSVESYVSNRDPGPCELLTPARSYRRVAQAARAGWR
jgi:hypothetical protein